MSCPRCRTRTESLSPGLAWCPRCQASLPVVRRKRRWIWIATAGVVFAGIVVGLVLLLRGGTGSEEKRDHEASFVERQLKTPFRKPVPIRELHEQDFLLQAMRTAGVDPERTARILTAFGIPTQPDEIRRTYREMIRTQVGAFYDPESRTVYLRSSPPPPQPGSGSNVAKAMPKAVLVHELVHALQDRRDQLGRRMRDLRDHPDALLDLLAMAESEAYEVMYEFLAPHVFADASKDNGMDRRVQEDIFWRSLRFSAGAFRSGIDRDRLSKGAALSLISARDMERARTQWRGPRRRAPFLLELFQRPQLDPALAGPPRFHRHRRNRTASDLIRNPPLTVPLVVEVRNPENVLPGWKLLDRGRWGRIAGEVVAEELRRRTKYREIYSGYSDRYLLYQKSERISAVWITCRKETQYRPASSPAPTHFLADRLVIYVFGMDPQEKGETIVRLLPLVEIHEAKSVADLSLRESTAFPWSREAIRDDGRRTQVLLEALRAPPEDPALRDLLAHRLRDSLPDLAPAVLYLAALNRAKGGRDLIDRIFTAAQWREPGELTKNEPALRVGPFSVLRLQASLRTEIESLLARIRKAGPTEIFAPAERAFLSALAAGIVARAPGWIRAGRIEEIRDWARWFGGDQKRTDLRKKVLACLPAAASSTGRIATGTSQNTWILPAVSGEILLLRIAPDKLIGISAKEKKIRWRTDRVSELFVHPQGTAVLKDFRFLEVLDPATGKTRARYTRDEGYVRIFATPVGIVWAGKDQRGQRWMRLLAWKDLTVLGESKIVADLKHAAANDEGIFVLYEGGRTCALFDRGSLKPLWRKEASGVYSLSRTLGGRWEGTGLFLHVGGKLYRLKKNGETEWEVALPSAAQVFWLENAAVAEFNQYGIGSSWILRKSDGSLIRKVDRGKYVAGDTDRVYVLVEKGKLRLQAVSTLTGKVDWSLDWKGGYPIPAGLSTGTLLAVPIDFELRFFDARTGAGRGTIRFESIIRSAHRIGRELWLVLYNGEVAYLPLP